MRTLSPKSGRIQTLGIFLIAGMTTGSFAQTASTPSTNAPASTPPNQTMSTIIVNAVPPDQSILPTSRPFTSGYGLDMNIMDTPRNVTVISSTQLSAIKLDDVRDFSKLTSSSYTGSDFGSPTVPDIRGQPADVYVNGMREGLSDKGTGLPFDFNSVESVNIVKGPADAVYGQSQYVGGYVDLITKRPYFDKFQGAASFTVGSFSKYEQTLDFGGPIIKDELAYRISYAGKEDGSFYAWEQLATQSGYVALSWLPKDTDYTLDFNAQAATYQYNESWGYNRPTQGLIDNNQYFAGPSTSGSTVLPTSLQGISQNTNLANPNVDGSDGVAYNGQLVQTLQLNDDIKLVNNTFGQYINRKTLDSYYYEETLNGNYSVENRTEVHWDFDNNITPDKKNDPGLTFKNQVNTGVDIRYQNVTAYDAYFDEPANFYDLTQPRSLIQPVGGLDSIGFQVPGLPSIYKFNSGNGDSNESAAISVGPFWQHHIDFTPQVALNYGGRVDVLFVKSEDPAGTPSPVTSTNTTQGLANFNVSPVYKIEPWLTSYFTYNYSQYTNQGTGGGYEPEGSGSYWSSADYHRTAELYETGFKFDLLDHTFFATLDAYVQNRIDSAQGGSPVQQYRRGIEAELNYQPNKEWFVTASYSLTLAKTQNPGFVSQLRPINELPYAGGEVQGVDSGGLLTGEGKTPGVPMHQFNFLAQYTHPSGFGANIGMVVTSDYNLSYGSAFQVAADFSGEGITTPDTVVIPWQYTLDTSLFYHNPRWAVDVYFYNVTDERNFEPVYAGVANTSVLRALPFNMEATFKIHF